MFFILSKVLYFLILPFSWIFLAFALSWVIRHPIRKRQLRKLTLVLLIVFSNPALSNAVLGFLEAQPQPIPEQKKYAYGVVLTGMAEPGINHPDQYHLSAGADRIIEAVRLYKKGVIEKMVISGGAASLEYPEHNEGIAITKLAEELGVNGADIIHENQAKNTYQNALHTAKIVDETSLLLITSAFHMPRARGCFEKQRLKFDVYPVDFRARPSYTIKDLVPSLHAMDQWHTVTKEIVGLIVYKMMGYI